ncbi:disulfide bond formation protein B [Chloroflexus sp. MS-CIW-1]|uniref:disulfide bond formation protein B n=1 Tax=Chloroflexus sp. MS-CIW-1 TaxID=3055768 RepID=UPI0026478ED4|nr:disulfide bond formation protein B [Chloroflexus sp. MS-CIW-1]MDN5273259.1 disulfide bond formation protein B [Chloroflexus sp. MS-CIW-1]
MDRAQSIELTATTPIGLLDWLTLSCRHVALLAAMLATGGSLFFSEVLGWIPCELCWYQRILMYPLTVLLFVGIWRDDRKVYLYVLPLSLMGIAVSLYHYLMVMLIIPPAPCAGAVPCAFDYINIPGALSFIKIPFLALIAFVIISVMMANLALAENTPACGRLARITATVIVVATALSFIGLGLMI